MDIELVRDAESQALPYTYSVRVCILTRSPGGKCVYQSFERHWPKPQDVVFNYKLLSSFQQTVSFSSATGAGPKLDFI